MVYVGMDVHKKTTTFCVVEENGDVVRQGKVESSEHGWLSSLAGLSSDEVGVALETGTMTWWVVEILRSRGIEPIVVNARQFKLVAASRKKSDRRDARTLADGLRTGLAQDCAVVVPSEKARIGRSLLRTRQTVVKQATISRNAAKGLLRTVGVTISRRQWLRDDAWSQVVSSEAVPPWLRPQLEAHRELWKAIEEQRANLDRRILQELGKWPEAAHLGDLPGYGAKVVLAVASSVDDPKRFPRSHHVGSYGGLAPSVRDSGETRRRGGITREGSALLRFYMVQAAQAALRSKALSPSLRRWATRLMARRGRQVAVVALARRLLELGYRLLRTGEVYDPNYGAVTA